MKLNKEYVFVTGDGNFAILKKVKIAKTLFYQCTRKDAMESTGIVINIPVFGNINFHAKKFDKAAKNWQCLGEL